MALQVSGEHGVDDHGPETAAREYRRRKPEPEF
jgi:hypothetical protein